MALTIGYTTPAMGAQRALGHQSLQARRQLERLSSGLRINRAADDASGLSVSEGMRASLAGLMQNVRNAEQATDLVQTAEGSLSQVSDILVRMRELAVASSTGTANDDNRQSMGAEFGQLVDEIDRIALATTYNGGVLLAGYGSLTSPLSTALTASATTGVRGVTLAGALAGVYTFQDAPADGLLSLGTGAIGQTLRTAPLLDGDTVASGTSMVASFDRLGLQVTLAGAAVPGATGSYADGDLAGHTLIVESSTGGVFQVGPGVAMADRIEMGMADLRGTSDLLNLDALSIDTQGGARQALGGIDLAINAVAGERGRLGAVQNRLSFSVSFTENEIENVQASESSIRDADVATEVADYTRSGILLRTTHAMLVQCNVTAMQVLSLL